MAEKFSEPREKKHSETRAESGNRAATLLAANLVAIAAVVLLFGDDDPELDDRSPDG